MGGKTNCGTGESHSHLRTLPLLSLCPMQACLYEAMPNERQQLNCICGFCFEDESMPYSEPNSDIVSDETDSDKELWLYPDDPLSVIKDKKNRNTEAKLRKSCYLKGTEYLYPPPKETACMRKKREQILDLQIDPVLNETDPLCSIKNKRIRTTEMELRKKCIEQGIEYLCPQP